MHVLRLLFVLTLAVGMFGCDSGGDDELDLYGTWETRGDDIIFTVITRQNITTYDFLGDAFDEGPECYLIDVTPITEVTESTITSTDTDFGTVSITYQITGDRLTVSFFGLSEIYYRSSRSVSSFSPECPAGTFKREE